MESRRCRRLDRGHLVWRAGRPHDHGGTGMGGGREFFFFVTSDIAAIRSGKWKYVRPGFRDSIPVLYDLEADPGETNTLRRFNPDVVNTLEKRIAQFR